MGISSGPSVAKAKADFYRKTVPDLKLKKPGQWYSCLKSITSHDQLKNEKPSVEEISHLSDQEQSEVITEQFEDYSSALEKCGLETLSIRREDRCLQYGLKSLLHPVHSKQFPVNPHIQSNLHDTRNSEHFRVNWARTDSYRMSAIPYIQRKLNDYVRKQNNT